MSKIKYKQDNVEQLMLKLNKINASFTELADLLKPLDDTPIIGEGISTLTKNANTLKTRAEENSGTITRGNESFASGETKNAQLIEKIEVPTELKKVYSPTSSSNENISLDKKDGKSVNEGELIQDKKQTNEENIDEEQLKNINKKQDDNIVIEDNNDANKEELEQINEEESSSAIIENIDDISKEQIGNINNIQGGNIIENNNITTEKATLESIETNNIETTKDTNEYKVDQVIPFKSFSSNENIVNENPIERKEEKEEKPKENSTIPEFELLF